MTARKALPKGSKSKGSVKRKPDDGPTREHPEDRRYRLEGERRGRKYAAEFCRDHARDMVLLIETYPDNDAETMLAHLRELFWAETWQPKGGAK